MTDLQERHRIALFEHYRVEQELSPGGMSTVYPAEDLKHHRGVAIKALNPDLAADPYRSVLGGARRQPRVRFPRDPSHTQTEGKNITPLP